MPASLALVKAYSDGAARQRAVSLWSTGSWGGSGFAALFGGVMVENVRWRCFLGSALPSLIGVLMVRGTPDPLGYAIAIVAFIRVGEKLLQRFGARNPMIWGSLIDGLSIALLMPANTYIETCKPLPQSPTRSLGSDLHSPSEAALSHLPDDLRSWSRLQFSRSSRRDPRTPAAKRKMRRNLP